jgi:hypothetical protein
MHVHIPTHLIVNVITSQAGKAATNKGFRAELSKHTLM